jgi:hypothetical protein
MNIQSWRNEKVRIKREYITLIDDPECPPYKPFYKIDTPNGLNGVYGSDGDPRDLTFLVLSDCFGTDLFDYYRKGSVNIDDLPEASHLLIIANETASCRCYPYLWEAKYFEIVTK